jgi:alkylation response protein AidB-like acyl-CoA dehydrogenase
MSEHDALYDATLRFAREIDARVDGERFDRDAWRDCARHGLLGLAMPREHGGSGEGARAIAAAYEAFGLGCRDSGLAFGLLGQLLSVQIPIANFGSEAVKAQYLPGLISGDLIAAHASTEADAGSDINRVRTVARAVPGGYRVSGAKIYSSMAPVADFAVVLARLEGDRPALIELLVPRELYATSRPISKIGLRSSPFGEIVLDEAFVPEDQVLGHAGSGLMGFMSTMEWERALIMAPAVGVMERQVRACVKYAQDRAQFGVPIGNFQAVAHRIADMKLRLETSRLLLRRAAEV